MRNANNIDVIGFKKACLLEVEKGRKVIDLFGKFFKLHTKMEKVANGNKTYNMIEAQGNRTDEEYLESLKNGCIATSKQVVSLLRKMNVTYNNDCGLEFISYIPEDELIDFMSEFREKLFSEIVK